METNSSYVQDMRERLTMYISKTKESQSRVSKELNVSKTQLSQFLNGVYPGNNNELAQKVEQFIKIGTARQSVIKAPDISLNVGNTKKVLQNIKAAHVNNYLIIVYGPAGCGKTTATKYYTQNNNGVIRIEARATSRSPLCILKKILAAINEKPKGTTDDMLETLINKLQDSNRLIIIDEAQHLSPLAFDTLRAINDIARVGIVYAGNMKILSRMKSARQEEDFEQVYSRIVYQCELKNKYTQDDISAIYSDYSFNKECLSTLHEISRKKGGLRRMVNQCTIAQNMAVALQEEFTLEHLNKAEVRMGLTEQKRSDEV
jgi:DNA transposition AAA+ family ATPase